MLNYMFKWLFGSSTIDEVLKPTKRIKVMGVNFLIKRIEPQDYLNGSKVMLQQYDIYRTTKNPSVDISENTINKIKEHYRDVFMAAVLDPKLSRKLDASDSENGVTPVGNLLTDWSFANELYVKIIEFTYGKKKMMKSSSASRASAQSSLTA